LIDDRGVHCVLEQVRVPDSRASVHPGRHAEVDTGHFAHRVRPDAGSAIADMAKCRQRAERAIVWKPVALAENEQAIAVASAFDLDLCRLTGSGIEPWGDPRNRGVDLITGHGGDARGA